MCEVILAHMTQKNGSLVVSVMLAPLIQISAINFTALLKKKTNACSVVAVGRNLYLKRSIRQNVTTIEQMFEMERVTVKLR